MANKKNKKKAQQPAPANNAAANSKVEAKKAVAKKNEKAEVQEEREAWFLRPHQEVFRFGEVRDEACHVAR